MQKQKKYLWKMWSADFLSSFNKLKGFNPWVTKSNDDMRMQPNPYDYILTYAH